MKLTEQRGAVAIDLDRRRLLFFSMASTWLVIERYGLDFAQTLYSVVRTGTQTELKLKDMDALCFMLWAGLQDELRGTGEDLSLETVAGCITPFNIRTIFNKVVVALTRTVSTPEQPGKVEAASSTAKPAAKKTAAKVSRLKVRSGLRQVRSAGR